MSTQSVRPREQELKFIRTAKLKTFNFPGRHHSFPLLCSSSMVELLLLFSSAQLFPFLSSISFLFHREPIDIAHTNIMAHTRWKKERETFLAMNHSLNWILHNSTEPIISKWHVESCFIPSIASCVVSQAIVIVPWQKETPPPSAFHLILLCYWNCFLLPCALCLVPYRSLYKEPWAATPFSSSLCWLRCMCVSLARVAIQKQKKQPAMSRAAARLELEEGTGINTNCARIIIWISWVPARYAWLLQSANNMNYCFVAGSRRSWSRPGVCVVSCPHWMLLFVTLLFEFSPILNTFQFFSVLWFSSALSFFFF